MKMNGKSKIVALGPDQQPDDGHLVSNEIREEPLGPAEAADEEYETEWGVTRLGWLFPALIATLVLAWSALFFWAHRTEMTQSNSLDRWSGWISDWSMPVLLVAVLWLLLMRNSKREASRFGDVSNNLAQASERLKQQLGTVNRELSLAREFLGAQSRELDSLGRMATERLSEHANRLSDLVHTNGLQIDAIASVSGTALENMERLRSDLPVVANSARDVTNQIGNAGRTAHNQLEDLVSGFHRLNEFGEASERQVQALRVKIDSALAAFEAQATKLEEITGVGFAALEQRSEEFRTKLNDDELEAITAIRQGTQALMDEIETTYAAVEEKGGNSLDAMRAHLAKLGEESAQIGETLSVNEDRALESWQNAVERIEGHLEKVMGQIDRADDSMLEKIENQISAFEARMAELRVAESKRLEEMQMGSEALATRLKDLGQQVEQVVVQSTNVQQGLDEQLESVAGKLVTSRETIDATGRAVTELTDSSVRLLELIQAAAQHSREDLPNSIEVAETHLSSLRGSTENLRSTLSEASEKGKALTEYIENAHEGGKATLGEIEDIHARLAEHNEDHAAFLIRLRSDFANTVEECENLANRSQGELKTAIETLEEAARSVVEQLGNGSTDAVQNLAHRITEDSRDAIDQALRNRAAEAMGQLEQAAAHAAGVSREAAIQLRDQLTKVDELAGNLERRVAHAREMAEEKVDNDFARRVALISESINSHAIDISKALSNEVTDTAWAAYLRGDRGIFTRRAVRLLDSSEARAIFDLYDEDPDFREHVSRYLHDFEAMLRQLLSTRDGHALSVTLLSSDMGKLYVALAQAVERLRN